MTVQAATKLLDDFRALPGRVARPRTFMEIAGYPHYENVCSNILAFFMDPNEPHELGTLVLDALATTGNAAEAYAGIGGNVSIGREVYTDLGNRIDLLIESDDRVILIENKIYAITNNPFADYDDYLNRVANGRAKRKLLLTLYPTEEGSEWNFANLTYEKLVGQARSLLGRYVSSADARYLTMFLDFLNTLENLRKGSRMDREFVELLAKRGDDVRNLFNDLKSLRKEMREKVQGLRDLLNTSQHRNVEEVGFWQADTVSMFDNLYLKIRVAEDLLVGIDTHLSPQGWEIQIFARDQGDPSKLKRLLQRLDIPFKEEQRFIHTRRFNYNDNLDQIAPVLQEVIDRLATSQGREG